MKLTFLIDEAKTKLRVDCFLHHGLFIIEMTIEYLTKDKIPEKQKMKTNEKARTARVQKEDEVFN